VCYAYIALSIGSKVHISCVPNQDLKPDVHRSCTVFVHSKRLLSKALSHIHNNYMYRLCMPTLYEPAGTDRHDIFLHPSHSSLKDAFPCVSPVVYKGESVGSVARITADGLLLSSTHIFSADGQFLETTAFDGHRLTLKASFPYLDVILLNGELPSITMLLEVIGHQQ